jgi:hypothetical protein
MNPIWGFEAYWVWEGALYWDIAGVYKGKEYKDAVQVR